MLYFALCGFALTTLIVAAPLDEHTRDIRSLFHVTNNDVEAPEIEAYYPDTQYHGQIGKHLTDFDLGLLLGQFEQEAEEIGQFDYDQPQGDDQGFLDGHDYDSEEWEEFQTVEKDEARTLRFEDADKTDEDKLEIIIENLGELDTEQKQLDFIQKFVDQLGMINNLEVQSEPDVQAFLTVERDEGRTEDITPLKFEDADKTDEDTLKIMIANLGELDTEQKQLHFIQNLIAQRGMSDNVDVQSEPEFDDVMQLETDSFWDIDYIDILPDQESEPMNQQVEDENQQHDEQDSIDKAVDIEQVDLQKTTYGNSEFSLEMLPLELPSYEYTDEGTSGQQVDSIEPNNEQTGNGKKYDSDIELLSIQHNAESDEKTYTVQMKDMTLEPKKEYWNQQNTEHVSFGSDNLKSDDVSSRQSVTDQGSDKQQISESSFRDNDEDLEINEILFNIYDSMLRVNNRDQMFDLDKGVEHKILTNLPKKQNLGKTSKGQAKQNKYIKGNSKKQLLENEVTKPKVVKSIGQSVYQPSQLSEDSRIKSPAFWTMHWGRAKDQANTLAEKIQATLG